ncbi:hypothetical protein HK100_010689 [Physocladia obscura]|uniref:tRNA (guanine(46)-N(7))-methyltransferase n=1 Tax=Physocladia obscura TaxID=109957 RepID=A0AAD5XLG4_9FUNG|nr:hypothetical protein HK100_010689 [Physocladia obscura]
MDLETLNEQIEQAQKRLDTWIDEHAANFRAKPDKETIHRHSLYAAQTELLRKRAELLDRSTRSADSCTWFMRRRGRFCPKQRTRGDPDSLCALHRAEKAKTSVSELPSDLSKPISEAAPHSFSTLPAPLPTRRKSNINKRMKRMLNPFRVREIPADQLPVWSQIYSDLSKPLMLDIGCAKGRYILNIESQHASCPSFNQKLWNFCGVELFAPLVTTANLIAAAKNKKNLHYVHANITTRDLERLAFPNLQRVSFLFADPWGCCGVGDLTSKKNEKRRVMSPNFALRLARIMPAGSLLYFASDWLDLAVDIRKCLLDSICFDIPNSSTATATTTSASTNKQSHVAVWPYVPTVSTVELSKNQSQLQLQVSQESSNLLIDVATNYAKPEYVGMEKNDDNNQIPVMNYDDCSNLLWLAGIPFGGVQTERDLVCEAQWRAVYRLVVVRNSNCK